MPMRHQKRPASPDASALPRPGRTEPARHSPAADDTHHGCDMTSSESSDAERLTSACEVIPVAREGSRVGKERVVTGRVRVSKRVRKREEAVSVPTITEEVEVTRVSVNRPVDGPVP